ncbi:UvrD-helicase domain-containing protein [Bacillus sp. 1P06AnD]|uniref:UvrD-helicase domain-containing protein n=1 Tax=Bacillus sp. 1P06AnD TaxID=3132208 RepID=UPI0039A247C1
MDLSDAIELKNSFEAIPLDEPFKLYAGPGAGKTTFLVNHIKRILNHSDKLKRSRKIACITYTNAAVNTLRNRLDGSLESIEITTIHSFCYKHIVKPFIWLLDSSLIAIDKLDGHDEIKLRKSQIAKIKSETRQNYLSDTNLAKALNKLQWILEKDKTFKLGFIRHFDSRVDGYTIKPTTFSKYKEIYWAEGKLSHDDVLYFAYNILLQEPYICEIIRGKFPYLLIDEFQDTSPLQVAIVELIAEKETTLGVIGDVCQSIYSFQGASVQDFEEFEVPQMKLYILRNNSRSSNEIITVLNHMRQDKDFEQVSVNNIEGPKPIIIIGSKTKSYDYFKNQSLVDLKILAYRKETLDTFQNPQASSANEVEYIVKDSNSERGWRIFYVIKSLEYAKQLKIKESLKAMRMAYRKESFTEKNSFENLKRLIQFQEQINNLPLTQIYNEFLYGHYNIKAKITGGAAKEMYDNILYSQAVLQMKLVDDINDFQTVHNAKGEEFENVLLIIPSLERNELSFLLAPNMNKEEHRVYYVALSRAKKGLYINFPNLPEAEKSTLVNIGFDVISVE